MQRNWAGNITYSAHQWHTPKSLEQVQTIIAKAEKVKVIGTRHSFNHIADTSVEMIDLTGWNNILELDTENLTVTVEAGVRYGELASFLDEAGYAIHNLASLPHISVVGAVSTATHGSGVNNGNLASAVTALEVVTADGELLTLTRDDERFAGAVVGLGALGVVTTITLKIEPTFDVSQHVYLTLPFEMMAHNFDAIMRSGYSVSLFTDWQSNVFNQIWVKRRITENPPEMPDTLFEAVAATQAYHPLAGLSPENCTQQLGVAGRWHERLPHFRMNFTPSKGDELQSEYLVPYENAVDAIRLVSEIRQEIAPLLLTCEVRSIAADDLWMSPCYQQPCAAVHCTWKQDWESVSKVLLPMEERLMQVNARPHWGKLFRMSPEYIRTQFPKWEDFLVLVNTLDPAGKFRNPFLDTLLFNNPTA